MEAVAAADGGIGSQPAAGLGECEDAHAAGGELEQAQSLLGHVSIQMAERYLGGRQRVRAAVNDRIGIEPED